MLLSDKQALLLFLIAKGSHLAQMGLSRNDWQTIVDQIINQQLDKIVDLKEEEAS